MSWKLKFSCVKSNLNVLRSLLEDSVVKKYLGDKKLLTIDKELMISLVMLFCVLVLLLIWEPFWHLIEMNAWLLGLKCWVIIRSLVVKISLFKRFWVMLLLLVNGLTNSDFQMILSVLIMLLSWKIQPDGHYWLILKSKLKDGYWIWKNLLDYKLLDKIWNKMN
jgi:hypothetical protein